MRPRMLDPERDLKGATPEKLAKALFRRSVPEKGPKKRSDLQEPDGSTAKGGRDKASSRQ